MLDPALGQRWWDRRYDFYHPPHNPELPSIWGTLDVVATYDRIGAVYEALHTAVREPYADTGLELRMHFSHWYLWGTMIYGRFVVPDGGPDALALHDRIWEDGMTAALDAGGVMNDHHGVGHQARARTCAASTARALDAMRRIKAALDPQRRHEPRQDGPVTDLTEEEETDGAEGVDAQLDAAGADRDDDHPARAAAATTGSRSRASRRCTTPDQVKGLLDDNGLECWGSVTLMTGGRDLVHEDHYVRLASVQYVKDCLSLVAVAGRQDPHGRARRPSARSCRWPRPRRSGAGRSRGSRSARRTRSRSACGSASSRSTASRPTSSTAPTRRSRWPRTSAATAASRSTSST